MHYRFYPTDMLTSRILKRIWLWQTILFWRATELGFHADFGTIEVCILSREDNQLNKFTATDWLQYHFLTSLGSLV